MNAAVTETLVVLSLLFAAGYFWPEKLGLPQKSETRRVLSAVVPNLFFPLYVFFVLFTTPMSSAHTIVPLFGILLVFCGVLLSFLLYARQSLTRARRAALALVAGWANITYLGLPLITSVYGPSVSPIPLLLHVFALNPILFLAGPLFEHWAHSRSQLDAQRLKAALREFVFQPVTVSAVLALFWRMSGAPVPSALLKLGELSGPAVTPIMTLTVGLALTRPQLRSVAQLLPALLIRLFAVPAIGLLLARAWIEDPILQKALVLDLATPTMIIPVVIAEKYRLDAPQVAQGIAVGTLFSFFTLPLWIQWLST